MEQYECKICGVLVVNRDHHLAFHRGLEREWGASWWFGKTWQGYMRRLARPFVREDAPLKSTETWESIQKAEASENHRLACHAPEAADAEE